MNIGVVDIFHVESGRPPWGGTMKTIKKVGTEQEKIISGSRNCKDRACGGTMLRVSQQIESFRSTVSDTARL